MSMETLDINKIKEQLRLKPTEREQVKKEVKVLIPGGPEKVTI